MSYSLTGLSRDISLTGLTVTLIGSVSDGNK